MTLEADKAAVVNPNLTQLSENLSQAQQSKGDSSVRDDDNKLFKKPKLPPAKYPKSSSSDRKGVKSIKKDPRVIKRPNHKKAPAPKPTRPTTRAFAKR